MKRLLIAVVTMALWIPPALADKAERYWPQWRGPMANGVAPHGDPPITWSENENVRFKVAIPGRGLASPIIWGKRIFLLTTVAADAEAYEASQQAAVEKLERREWPPKVEPVTQRFVVMALSRRDGRVLWQRTAAERTPHESHYPDSSWASASPVTDGKRLYAHFGSNGLFAYNLRGKLLWHKDLGDMTTRNGFGEGSSPAVFGDLLVINWDHEGDSFIVGLDARTGEERWRRPRPEEPTSWATPLIVDHGSRPQVIVPATGKSRGYDLATGDEIWSAGGMTVNVIPSPVHRDGVVYLMSGYRGNMVQAVDLAKASGDVTASDAIVWSHDRHTPYVPSPILYGDRLYFLKRFSNVLTCLDAGSGEVLYTEERLEGLGNVYASPVGAAGRIYVVGREGEAVVFKHGDELEVLATNELDDSFEASPAIVGDEIYLRGRRYLYAISAAD
ncbi:MAG: PQQ-binding-like beta-propeller repeat protein [Thermoanaerobaculia bacterium]